MAPNEPISPELWARAEELFDLLCESADPEAILRAEPDSALAALARRLWEGNRNAGDGFLEDSPTLVQNLSRAKQSNFQAGQQLAGRFTVESLLGTGGMGEVYLAWDSVICEKVALKTIRRDLAAYSTVARRFLSEVRSARSVTHPNVCRINDIFDDDGTPFFTMQYLEGPRLADWLKSIPTAASQPARRRIALQLAEGLAAAHRARIVHCDFKPSNVILTGPVEKLTPIITDFGLARAFATPVAFLPYNAPGDVVTADHSLQGGTRGYMAPELAAGAPANVRTDIYAFGKVLGELLPGHRLAAQCTALRPEDRPESLEPVAAALGGVLTRRLWLAGGTVAAGVTATGLYAVLSRPIIVIASRQRIAVNWFHPAQARNAFILRDLLLTALRQSPLFNVMADDRLRALLNALKFEARLPAEPSGLRTLAAHEGALAVEGFLEPRGTGLRLLLQVFQLSDRKPALSISEEVGDAKQLVALADKTALKLRRKLGESGPALQTGYTPLAKVTSASPEAIELYYRALDEYAKARANDALIWLDEALRLDPDFVLANLEYGIILASQTRTSSALPYYERAFTLRARLSQRERVWVESRYYNIVHDYAASLAACRKLTVLFPDEASFHRYAGFAATRAGRPRDALAFNDRALELDPDNELNRAEWLLNRCDAHLFDEALARFRQYREQGDTNTLLDSAAGVALTAEGDFESADAAFVRMGMAPERQRLALLQRSIPRIASGDWAQAASNLASEIAFDAATGEEFNKATRQCWLATLLIWTDQPDRAIPLTKALCSLAPLPVWLQPLREGAILALDLGLLAEANLALESLREIERKWPSTNSQGSRAGIEGLLLAAAAPDRAAATLTEAFGLWPDPINLWIVGRFRNQRGDFAGALAPLEALEEARGRVLRLFFPGLLTQGRIEYAKTLAGLSRFEESARLYQRVLEDWLPRAARYKMARQTAAEYAKLLNTRMYVQGEKHD